MYPSNTAIEKKTSHRVVRYETETDVIGHTCWQLPPYPGAWAKKFDLDGIQRAERYVTISEHLHSLKDLNKTQYEGLARSRCDSRHSYLCPLQGDTDRGFHFLPSSKHHNFAVCLIPDMTMIVADYAAPNINYGASGNTR